MPYTIDGQAQSFAEPIIQDNTTFVPLGNIVDVIGGFTEWDNTTKVATVELNGRKFTVEADNPNVGSAGYTATLQAAPFIQDDTLWVPVRFFENIVGGTISASGSDVSINRPQ